MSFRTKHLKEIFDTIFEIASSSYFNFKSNGTIFSNAPD